MSRITQTTSSRRSKFQGGDLVVLKEETIRQHESLYEKARGAPLLVTFVSNTYVNVSHKGLKIDWIFGFDSVTLFTPGTNVEAYGGLKNWEEFE